MRVLYLATDVFSKGGIQRYSRYQIRAFREELGAQAVTACSLWGPDQSNKFEEEFAVDYSGTGISAGSKLAFAWRASLFARSKKVDLVVCNHVALAPIAYIIRTFWGIPYVVNVYGLEIWNGLNAIKRKGLCAARMIIGDCNFILEYIRNHFPVAPEQLALLYDCVDMEVFAPRPAPAALKEKYAVPPGAKVLMTIGRLVYDKGQVTMIRTMKLLPAEMVFVIVGGGPEREAWEALAVREGVRDRVIFTGRVPDEELISIYNLCDLFIYLSEFKKNEGGGLPLVSIEAAACAKPILTSNEDGAREAVEDGVTGFIVPPRDLEGIAARIKELFTDPARPRTMGLAGREYTQRRFSYEVFRRTQKEIIDRIA